MNIGEAAAASGVSAKMIRYYEEIGLISPPARTESGYRTYGGDDISSLRFVRRARDLGFTVEQIGNLMTLWRDRSRASADVKKLALSHVKALEDKMREIEEMAAALRHLAENCHGDDRPGCPIIEELSGQHAAPGKGRPAGSGNRPSDDKRRTSLGRGFNRLS
jgi:MerR family transcriptional regulator, copper efflux regulator